MGGQGGGGIIKEGSAFSSICCPLRIFLCLRPHPPPPPPHLGAFLLLSYPPVRIHLHSSLIVSCSGLPLQLAIHLGGGRETAPDLSYRTKQRCMRMPLVAVCGTGSTQLHSWDTDISLSILPPSSLQCHRFCPASVFSRLLTGSKNRVWSTAVALVLLCDYLHEGISILR